MEARGPGYHLAEIPRGEFGGVSKIIEEALELQDAHNQSCRVMELVELSDLIGAIKAYMSKFHPSYSLTDLEAMATITGRAFSNGHRTPRTQ